MNAKLRSVFTAFDLFPDLDFDMVVVYEMANANTLFGSQIALICY